MQNLSPSTPCAQSAISQLQSRSRQPERPPWDIERFARERAITLGMSLETSTREVYSSAARSYLNFCKIHKFPIEPTPDNLCNFVLWLCASDPRVSPSTASGYLSGICSVLEPFYPDIRSARNSNLVSKTLAGLRKRFSVPARRKRALSIEDIKYVYGLYQISNSLDDLLFAAMFAAGFHALHRLGELCWADEPQRRNYRRIIMRSSVSRTTSSFSYLLPAHKADMSYSGNVIRIESRWDTINPIPILNQYLSARDSRFPYHCELWLRSDGVPPTKSWFRKRLATIFPSDISGHSLRSGGATALAIHGVPDNLIQKIGRWSSDAWQIYVRVHPVVLAGLVTDTQRPERT
ncbi:hypothetical protein RSAG8_12965, partial [Rhizoctonia solani AG-8 WAC10335]